MVQQFTQFFRHAMPPVTRRVFYGIWILFLASLFLLPWMERWLVLRPATVLPPHFMLWQLFTYAFLHFSLGHIFVNSLALFFFGGMVEQHLGPRRTMAFILAAVLFGGIVHTLLYWGVAVAQGNADIATIGAIGISGVTMAILVGCLFIAPNAQVFFFFIPMRLKTMVLLILGIEIWFVFSSGIFAPVSHIGHLAGALIGFLAFKFPRLLNFSEGKPVRPGKRMQSKRLNMGHPGRSTKPDSRYDDPHWRLDQ